MDEPQQPVSVRQVTPGRLPIVAGVLGHALAVDPIFQWVLGGRATPENIAQLARGLYARPVELGMVWEGGGGSGVAVWVPPGGVAMIGSAADGEVALPTSNLVGTDHAEMWDWLESCVPDDAWYLEVLGVDPLVQGVGVGTALIRHGLDRAKAGGVPAFLETSVAANVAFYRRFGFDLVDEGDSPCGGPHVWFMRLDP